LVEKYRLTSVKTAEGYGDKPLEGGSFNLSPGESRTTQIHTMKTEQTKSSFTNSVMEEDNKSAIDELNSHVASSENQAGSKESVDYHLNANFHGEAGVTLGGGEVDASLAVQGGCNTVRNSFSQGVDNALDNQSRQVRDLRKQRVSTGELEGESKNEVERTD